MSNPFNKLRVERDEDDFVTVHGNKNDSTLFPKDAKPKKKVRQEDVKAEPKEETVNHNDNEGFVTVGKVKKYNNNKNYDNVEVVEQKPGKSDNHNKRYHEKREDVQLRHGTHQRLFDKHSGTGYDKTIKKHGRGGKYTWEGQGREVVDYSTDYYFNKALNPQKFEKVVEVSKEEVKVEEKVEEVVPEEVTNTEEVSKDRKKKGPVTNPEEDEKNKLVIPENAISLSEWKNNKKVTTNVSKTSEIQSKFEVLVKNEDTTIQVGDGKKEKKAKKEKKVNQQELDLNQLIGSKLKIEDNSFGGKPFNKRK